MAVGSDDTLTVWVNGKQVYDFHDRRGFDREQARFDVTLTKGTQPGPDPVRQPRRALAVRRRRDGPRPTTPSSRPRPAAGSTPRPIRAVALKGRGEPERGRAPLRRPEGPGLHQVPRRRQGGGRRRAGALERRRQVPARRADRRRSSTPRPRSPRATSRSSSPSPTAASSPGSSRTRPPTALEIQDADAKRVRIAKDDIEERKRSDVSLMPNGLAEGLTPRGLRRPDRLPRDAQGRQRPASGRGTGRGDHEASGIRVGGVQALPADRPSPLRRDQGARSSPDR